MFRMIPFPQRHARRKLPRFKFIDVHVFAGVVFGESFSRFAGAADVGLLGIGLLRKM
jgi:hypothetical protein